MHTDSQSAQYIKHVVFVPAYVNVLHVPTHVFWEFVLRDTAVTSVSGVSEHGICTEHVMSFVIGKAMINPSISWFPHQFSDTPQYHIYSMVVYIPLKYTKIHSHCGQMVFLTPSFWSRAHSVAQSGDSNANGCLLPPRVVITGQDDDGWWMCSYHAPWGYQKIKHVINVHVWKPKRYVQNYMYMTLYLSQHVINPMSHPFSRGLYYSTGQATGQPLVATELYRRCNGIRVWIAFVWWFFDIHWHSTHLCLYIVHNTVCIYKYTYIYITIYYQYTDILYSVYIILYIKYSVYTHLYTVYVPVVMSQDIQWAIHRTTGWCHPAWSSDLAGWKVGLVYRTINRKTMVYNPNNYGLW